MKETVFKKLMSLVLCAVMLVSVLPAAAHAEETQETFVEGNEEYSTASEQTEAYVEEVRSAGMSDADRQAVLHRNMGVWQFPLIDKFFANINDYCGCRGNNPDPFYGLSYDACKHPNHATDSYGNAFLAIECVYDGTEVMAPTEGTMYRGSYADSQLGYNVVIEQKAGNDYSYYIILANISSNAPVATGTAVVAGNVVGFTQGFPLLLGCAMDRSGRGQQLADDLWYQLDQIGQHGWLTENYGTGLICTNPSRDHYTHYRNYITDFLDGPITYGFTEPVYISQPVQPTEAPTQAPTEAPTQAPTEAPTQAPHTEHTWDGGMMVLAPTHFANGEMVFTCTTCGATEKRAVPATADHVYDQQNVADAYLVRAASCAGPATYNYSCICGARGTETFTVGAPSGHTFSETWSMDTDYHWHAATCEHTGEKDSVGLHTWDQGSITVNPSHTASGEAVFTCTICGARKTAPVAPSAQHVYDQKVQDAKYLVSAATCTSPAVYRLSCVCGEAGNETFTVGEAKGHTFADAWTSNDTHHWHAATCEHTGEISGFAEHTWDQGRTNAQAGHNTNGETVFTCTVCGKTRNENVPGQPHQFDQMIPAEKYLKTPATCTEPAVYYKSCTCGEAGTDTFTSGEPKGHTYSDRWTYNELQHWQAATCEHTNEKIKIADHIWDGGVITVQPTSASRGERTFTCVVCGFARKEALEPTTHTHTFSQTWSGNETYHWHAATCEHTNEISDFGEHVWNGGVVTAYASHGAPGETVYTCLTCNATKKVTTPAQHVFNQQNTAGAYVKSYATCVSPATYYYSCSCGAKGTETFTTGSAAGHSYSGNWSYDDNSHWRTCSVCGSKGEITAHYFGTAAACQTCGYAKKDSHIHTSHLSRVPAKTATCTEPGNITYYTCECGKWFTDVSATVEITDRNSVVTAATGHVDKDNNGKCDVCKERLSTEAMEYTMTEGADSTWLNTSNQGLVFRCSADYSKFDRVEVDGSTVSALNYTVSSGSTIVELNANFMKRLTIGQHKLSIVSTDGRANAMFTVKQGSASNREEGGRSVLWVVVAGIAILAMIAAAVVAGYILYTNRNDTGKKGGKFAK